MVILASGIALGQTSPGVAVTDAAALVSAPAVAQDSPAAGPAVAQEVAEEPPGPSPGLAAGIVYTGRDKFPITFVWDSCLTASPAIPIWGSLGGTLSGEWVAAGTVQLSVPLDWVAARLGFAWSEGFRNVLTNTWAGPAAYGTRLDLKDTKLGLAVKWTAYSFDNPF
jgi:hypothetical protein